jgi:hypothetical protein
MMAVFVFIGCVTYRSQKVYADAITLTGEGLEVLFGLLGATGVVVGFEETMEKRFEEAQELFDSLPVEQQQSYVDWLAAGQFVTSDTGHSVFYPDMTLDASWYGDLWQSVTAYTSTFVTYSPAIEGLQNYDFPADGSGDFYTDFISLGSCSDSPFFVRTLNGASEVFSLLPDGHFLRYVVDSSTGSVSVMDFVDCPLNAQLQLKAKYLKVDGCAGAYCSLYVTDIMGPTMWGKFSNDVANPAGIAWGSADSGFVSGLLASGSMVFYNGIASTAELVPCDTWVSKWDDAKAEGGQVGIITGQDISGYDTLEDFYDVETGLVTGLDSPAVVPDVPATGDLSDVLSKLNSLPATIATAVVGEGSLDFSGFNNIALSGVFPFCIPFDLINTFKSFGGVEPIEPKWTVDFSGTPLEAGGSIELDLTQFELWASIVRYFCYASVVLGLILVTRKIIKG